MTTNPLKRQYTDADALEYSTCYHILKSNNKDSNIRRYYATRLQECLDTDLEAFLDAVLPEQKAEILELLERLELPTSHTEGDNHVQANKTTKSE